MAEIKLQDIQAEIQKYRKENPQKVKGLNDEHVASIMLQEGKLPKEVEKQLAQILSGQYVNEEGMLLGQKSRAVTGKDKDGNLKTDIYIDFNGDNVADLKIFKQGNNVSIFASQQSNGEITGWTTTNDYDEYKSAVFDTVEINNAEKKQKAEKTKPSAETKKTEEPKPAEDMTKPEETNNDPVSTGKEEPAKIPEDKEKEKLAKKEANIKEHLIQIFRDEELKELFLSVSPETQNALLNKDPKKLGITKSGIPSNKYKKAVKEFLEDNCKDNNEIRNAYLTSCDREDLAKFFLKPLAEQEKLLNSDNIMQSFAPQKVVNPQAEAAKLERLKRKFLSNADEKTKEYFKQLDSEGQRLFLYAYEHDFNHQTFKDARGGSSESFKEVVLNDFLERHKVSQEELEERKAANNVKRQRRDFVSSADKETLTFFKQLSDEGQKVFLEAYENGSSEEILKNKSEFLEKYKASDETIQHRKQESTFRAMLTTIDSFKTAQECQIFIDRINEENKDKIDKYKYVLDAAQTKMSSFPPEEIAKAQDPAWREEMRISREMNHLTARTLLDRQLKASVDLDRQLRQMGWTEYTGQAIVDIFGESDIEEAYANYDAFREKVSRLYASQYTMTREEFGKEVEKIMGQGKYDHKLVEKIQRNHPEYLQLTSAKNTVDSLNALAEKEYSEESIREMEQAFGGIDKIKEYMPNYEEYSDETKFVNLKSLVRASASNAKAQLDQTLNGRNYDDVIKAHEADYEKYLKMIGVKDIEQKMQEYREDVASAAGWVKCAVTVAGTVALTVATGGAGGVLAAGLIATGTSAAVEVSNRATNDVADLSSWSDWGEIGQSAAIDGLSTALGMKAGGKILASTMGKYAKFGASVASDTAIGAAAEFAQTGQVTVEGTLMNAAMAGAGNGLAVYVEGKGTRKYTPNKDLPVYKPPIDGQIAVVNTNKASDAIKILENSNIKNSTGTLSVLNPQNTKELTNNQVLILNMVVNLKDKSRISMELVDKLLANGDPRFADACLSRNLDFVNLPPEKHATLVELHTAVDKNGYPKYPNLSLEDVMSYNSKQAKLFDKAYSFTDDFGNRMIVDKNIEKVISNPKRFEAIIDFFEKNKDCIKNRKNIDYLLNCTDAEFKTAIDSKLQSISTNETQIINFAANETQAPLAAASKTEGLPSKPTKITTDEPQKPAPTKYTAEQINKIMQENGVLSFDKPELERLAQLAPETLENILKNPKAKNHLGKILSFLRELPDDELKNLKGNMPIAQRIKDKNLPPELQQDYMNILLSDNASILYKLDCSDQTTCKKILESIKKIPEDELKVINDTLMDSLDPVEIKKAMTKIGLSNDDIPINNNQKLTQGERALLTKIIFSSFDFTSAEINEILKSGKAKTLSEIKLQKAQKKIMLTEGVLNNGEELSLNQKDIILELANTGKKYTIDEINKMLNAPQDEISALIALYSKKPENYSLTLGEDLRIDSKDTILEFNGKENYSINMNREDMQEALNNLQDGESFYIRKEHINSKDPGLSPILAIVKKENGQIIIQDCSVNGITINPNNNIPINNVRANNTAISADYEHIIQSYNITSKNNFILSKIFENPELKNINPELIEDMFNLNCADTLYKKIVAGEKITKQTLTDLRTEGFTNLVKNSKNEAVLREILNSQDWSTYDIYKILHAQDFVLDRVAKELAAGNKLTPELFNKITSDVIIEQIQNGQCKFSASDKQIVDVILNSPYAKDFTSTELINILNNEQYRQIVLGRIKDGQPIMKELFYSLEELSPEFIMSKIKKETSVHQINKDESFSLTYEQKKYIAKKLLETGDFEDIVLADFLRIIEDKNCMIRAINLINDNLSVYRHNIAPDFTLLQSCLTSRYLNEQHSTSTLLNISNKELHKKTSANTNLYAKGYPEIHQSVIDNYYKNPVHNQQAINKIIPIGELRKTANGTLYYNSGEELIKIGLDEETFRDLFPTSMTYKLNQGSICDCWLISGFGALMDTPVGKGQIFKLFSQEGDIISLKLPDAKEPIKFKREKIGEINLDSSKFGQKTMSSYAYVPIKLENITSQSYTELAITTGNAKKIIKSNDPKENGTQYTLKASKGLRMLELACADFRADDLFKGSKTTYHSVDELMNSFDFLSMKKILDGGFTIDAINLVCGQHNTKRIIDKLDLSNVDVNAYMDVIDKHIKNPNSVILFGLKGNNDNFYWNKEFDLVKQHAYRVVGINKAKGTITISNPHHNNMTVEIPFMEWIRYVSHCEVVDIR